MIKPFRIALLYNAERTGSSMRILTDIAAQINDISGNLQCSLLPIHDASYQKKIVLKKTYDGAIAIQNTNELLEDIYDQGIPCIAINDARDSRISIDQVCPDNTAIGHLGGEFFIEQGLQYFAFCSFQLTLSSIERHRGFQEAIRLAGRNCYFFNPSPSNSKATRESLEQAIIQWIRRLPKPIGIMVANDNSAHQLILLCRESSISIPEEVRLLGVGNDNLVCELSTPTISSIELDYKYWAKSSIKALTESLAKKCHKSNIDPVEPIEVVQRRSTEPSAVNDGHVARAIRLIHDEASQGLTVNQIVQKLNISRSCLERRFRKQLGRSPQSELRKTKLILVKKLLHNTDLTVAEIADKTGFEYPEYLYVAFKKRYRMTPIQYRKRYSTFSSNSTSPINNCQTIEHSMSMTGGCVTGLRENASAL